MTRIVFLLSLAAALAACKQPVDEPSGQGRPATLLVAGSLENDALREASGIARSARDPGILWLHNDSGDKARLYAIDLAGRHRARLKLDKSDNRDWEDIASFTLDGTPYLLVADIGDNDSRHREGVLYVVEEPDLAAGSEFEVEPAWRIRFSYPGGPRDAEAVAVDTNGERVLILSKRELPPVLYSVPLKPAADAVRATALGPVTSLPPPSRRDVEAAPRRKDWSWQPTAMDFAADGSAAVVLTEAGLYYFAFDGDWYSTLNQQAMGFGLRGIGNAESAAFDWDGHRIFVTVEGKHAPLYRIDMEAPER